MTMSSREAILASAKRTAMAHGYNGLNFRDVAAEVGIKAASVYHHFPSKADLGAAVARRYWEDTVIDLDTITAGSPDAMSSLSLYPSIFRIALANQNRMCLCSFMAAEYDDLPPAVQTEVRTFADVNVAWLATALTAAGITAAPASEPRARAIFAAIAGAQLLARSRADIALYDTLIDSYRTAGLLPA